MFLLIDSVISRTKTPLWAKFSNEEHNFYFLILNKKFAVITFGLVSIENMMQFPYNYFLKIQMKFAFPSLHMCVLPSIGKISNLGPGSVVMI